MTADADVIVVGGGLAGLAAGAMARAGGARTIVLESHHPGGRARTTEREGFVFNRGGHALYAGGPGMAVLHSLGVRPTGSRPPLSRYRLLMNGRQHILPTGPSSLVRTDALSRRSKTQFGGLLGLLSAIDPKKLQGTSISEWLANRALRPDTDAIARALVRLSTYAADLDHFGADAAVAQLKLASKGGVLYVDDGWAQLIDGLQHLVEVRSGVAVRGLDATPERVAVFTDDGVLTARSVVLAVGTPDAARAVLPGDARWGELGDPVTAACLDVGVARPPRPGYVLGVDEPLYGTTQSPPARQAPTGRAVVALVRYQARSAVEDRPQLEEHLSEVGVSEQDVVVSRFLARMVVSGVLPRAERGGLPGRPAVSASGLPGVFMAGDWVGPTGLLADAALASARAAATAALRRSEDAATMVG